MRFVFMAFIHHCSLMTRHILGFVRSEICLLKLWTHEMILAATDIFMG